MRSAINKIAATSFVNILLSIQCFAMSAQVKGNETKLKQSTNFSTSQDLAAAINSSKRASGFSIQNSGIVSKLLYGLYVRQFSYVTPGQSCSSATVMYSSSENKAAGSVVMPVRIDGDTEATVGANYLYNMIYNAIYYLRVIVPSSPPGCALPGCTWGSDSTIYNWCLYVGALSPVSVTENYTAKVAPSSTTVSGAGYNYDLITSFRSIGPISCDDQTLTCFLATPQKQSL